MGFWNIVGGLANVGASVYSQVQTNKNIDKQLAAQQKENNATREYNLNLARQQNQWNIEQWNRENAYNTPAAQIERMKQAGLNVDMAYGQGALQNASASSPQMTSGAPATPVDWSALGGKRTIGDALASSLSNEMARAQIDAVKADTKKTLADAGLSEIALTYADAKERLNLKLSEEQFKLVEQQWQEVAQTIENKRAELESISLKNARQMIENAYQADVYQKQIKILASELKIKEEEAANAARYFAAQVLGMDADNAWKDAAWIVEQRDGTATLIKYGSEMAIDLLSNLSQWLNPKSWIGGKGKTKHTITRNAKGTTYSKTWSE